MCEVTARGSFKNIMQILLANKKSEYYKQLFSDLQNYKGLGCNMSLKIHFLENLTDVSDEQGKRFINKLYQHLKLATKENVIQKCLQTTVVHWKGNTDENQITIIFQWFKRPCFGDPCSKTTRKSEEAYMTYFKIKREKMVYN